ncbi:MAG: zinc ribbon domain-containing protein [Dehalococcoidia bacterium]|nr:zinc ribbon domain-containing protein [Dehalococcoidia bacterium]HRC61951.1 zinc ribbon domain-containing protein [Dehalococcoidia bacterium]
MPLYEYYCTNCNGIFELLRPISQATDPQPCVVCDSESKRIMPTEFAAFVMRDGMPRRIPDQGLSWGLEGQLKNPLTSSEAKKEDIVPEERKRRASTVLSEDEKVASKPEIRVRPRKKKSTAKAKSAK